MRSTAEIRASAQRQGHRAWPDEPPYDGDLQEDTQAWLNWAVETYGEKRCAST